LTLLFIDIVNYTDIFRPSTGNQDVPPEVQHALRVREMIIERTNNHTGSDDSDLDGLLEEIEEGITPSRVVEGNRSLVQNNAMTLQRSTLQHSIPDNRNEVMNPVDIKPSFSMGASIGLRQARNFAVTGRNSNTRRVSLPSANSSDERNNRWEQREEENRLRW